MALLVSLRSTLFFNRIVCNVPKQHFSIFQVSGSCIKRRPILRYVTQKRTFLSFLRKPTKLQITKKDGIPDGYELIYRNTSERIIMFAQIVTTASAIFVAGVAIFSSEFDIANGLPFTDENFFKTRPRDSDNEMLFYVAFFIVTLVILQTFIAQMPQRIYYNGKAQKYWLVFNSNIPLTTRKMQLKVGEIRHSPGGLTPWKGDRYEIKNGQKLLLMESYFRRSADLYIMMGVQKDPDFENNE